MKETLDRDHWISWRRRSEEFALTLDEGDPVVITISPNGHDANASILARPGECKRVPKQQWFTIETLEFFFFPKGDKNPKSCFQIDVGNLFLKVGKNFGDPYRSGNL